MKWGEVGWGFWEKISKLENEKMRKLANGVRVTSLHQRRLTLPKFETKTVRKIYKALIFNYVFL